MLCGDEHGAYAALSLLHCSVAVPSFVPNENDALGTERKPEGADEKLTLGARLVGRGTHDERHRIVVDHVARAVVQPVDVRARTCRRAAHRSASR